MTNDFCQNFVFGIELFTDLFQSKFDNFGNIDISARDALRPWNNRISPWVTFFPASAVQSFSGIAVKTQILQILLKTRYSYFQSPGRKHLSHITSPRRSDYAAFKN